MPGRPEWLSAGTVGRPHGVDGSFHVLGARSELLAEGGRVRVGEAELRVVRRAGTDARPIVRLEGAADRDAAAALRGRDLLVPAGDAAPLGEDEWWAEELEGCRVHDGELSVGVVRRLVALPSCEALEVAREDGGRLLVPMVADAVRRVDVAARRIDIDLRFLDPTGAG